MDPAINHSDKAKYKSAPVFIKEYLGGTKLRFELLRKLGLKLIVKMIEFVFRDENSRHSGTNGF